MKSNDSSPIIAKKYLGQNFLVDQKVMSRIVEACELSLDETVLEIGPGQGALTQLLLPSVKHVVAVETDRVLAESLQDNLAQRNITVCHADFLKFNLHQLQQPLKIIGNIPYNISTPILTKIIEDRRLISSVYMTIQYEFGLRLIAASGSKDYSSISCFMQMFTNPKILFKIAPQSFRPVPKVMSCLLKIEMRQTPLEPLEDELFFIRIVRMAFAQRRKNLLNALSPLFSSNKSRVGGLLEKAGINARARAEELTISQYARIANVYAKNLLS
ncbi:MAG: 16S rRNA (adenine(1518)-N(6)/adenine(1519)-N(6))-dimethyltransferase RsmA [Candidatus Omnitrophota bacterium]